MNLTRLKSSCQAQNEAFGQNLLLDPSENISRNRSFLHRKVVKGSVPGSWLGGGAIATSLRCGSAAALAAGKVESPPVIAVFLMSSNISRRVISPPSQRPGE